MFLLGSHRLGSANPQLPIIASARTYARIQNKSPSAKLDNSKQHGIVRR